MGLCVCQGALWPRAVLVLEALSPFGWAVGVLSTRTRIIWDWSSSIAAGGSPTSAFQRLMNSGRGIWVSEPSSWGTGAVDMMRSLFMGGVRTLPHACFDAPSPRVKTILPRLESRDQAGRERPIPCLGYPGAGRSDRTPQLLPAPPNRGPSDACCARRSTRRLADHQQHG